MTVHDVTLGVPRAADGGRSYIWSPPSAGREIPTALVAGGGRAFLRLVNVTDAGQVIVRTNATDSGTGGSAGPDFSTVLEQNLAGWQFIQGGVVRATLSGATVDPLEPYVFTGQTALYNAVRTRSTQSWVLRLDDGVSQTRDATLPATALGAISAPALSPTRVAPLALADLDLTGRDVECAALIQTGAAPSPPNDVALWAVPPRGTVGAILDGDLNVGPSETALTRLFWNGTVFRFNDNDSPAAWDPSTYFAGGGAGNDLRCDVVTDGGSASFPVAGNLGMSGGNFFRLNAPAAVQTLMNALASGDRLIFALSRVGAGPQVRDAQLPATALGSIAAPALSPSRVARPPATRDAQLPATVLGGIAAPALSPVRVARDARTVDVTLPATALGALAAPALSPQRVARPPETRDATLALRATDTTFRSLTVTWNVDHEPDFVRFDIRLDDGSWIRTTDTSHVFDDLEPGTEHTVTLRSVRESGNVEQSIMAYTAAATEPSVVRLPRIRSNGDTTARVDVVEPESDGGHDITHYEYAVDGGDYESTNGPETTWTIRGLALGRKYAIMIRARTAFAPGDSVVLKHDTRQRAAGVRTPVHRQRIPLPNDDDRLSAIIRIGDRECLLRLWWQPYDSAWYATFESPVGTPLVSGRRIAAGAPVLGPGPGRRTMGGDIWCRRLAGSGEPHERPWGITHVLVWEATR